MEKRMNVLELKNLVLGLTIHADTYRDLYIKEREIGSELDKSFCAYYLAKAEAYKHCADILEALI